MHSQVSYVIGDAEPIAVDVHSYGTGTRSDEELKRIVERNFSLKPGRIIEYVKLTVGTFNLVELLK